MLRSICRSGDERKVDVRGCRAGKLFFCLLCCFFQSLESHLVVAQINAFRVLELGKHPVSDLLVEVVAAQTVVAGSGKNLDNSVADLDDGNIECTAAEVVNHDLLLFLIVKAICQSCRCRLVDDTFYIKACDLARILGRLTLRVVEICGNGDNRLSNCLAKISFRVFFQFLKDHCGNLLGRIFLAVDGYTVICTHLSLDGGDCLLRVGHCLTFCRLAYQTFSVLCKRYNRGCCSCAFCIGDNGGLSAFHYCHTTVCCT